MRRIVMLLAVVAMMVALAAGPVFAGGGGARTCNVNPQGEQCHGGFGFGGSGGGTAFGGGSGLHDRYDGDTYVISGSFGLGGVGVSEGGGASGGAGGHCTSDLTSNPPDCVGSDAFFYEKNALRPGRSLL
jgi:hypothetical protein